MNNKIAGLFKTYLETLSWADKVAGLVQTASIRTADSVTKTYPISCDVTADACIKGEYQALTPDSKKKSVMYFEDHGGVPFISRIGNTLKFSCKLRLIIWLNLKLIQEAECAGDATGCGSSGDYVIEAIKKFPAKPFKSADFISIYITNISQVERSVDIFSRYSYSEVATQYLMFPFDFAALDIDTEFTIPCIEI